MDNVLYIRQIANAQLWCTPAKSNHTQMQAHPMLLAITALPCNCQPTTSTSINNEEL